MCYIPKTWKTIIHSSKNDDLELYILNIDRGPYPHYIPWLGQKSPHLPMSTAHQEPSPAVLSPHHSGPTGPSSTWLSSGAQAADVKLQVGQDVFHGDFNVLLNFERGHSNRRSKHNAVFSWNCPKLLVQAFVLFRDSFRDWQPKMLQTCTHAMEISTTNMRTNISFCFPCLVFIWRYLNDVIGCYMYNVLIRYIYIYIMISCYYSKYHVDVLYIYIL